MQKVKISRGFLRAFCNLETQYTMKIITNVNSVSMIGICKTLFCLLFPCLILISNLIRSRKPFKLNGILIPYNLAMAILNAFIFYRLGEGALRLNYSIYCEPCRQIDTKYEMQVSLINAVNDLTSSHCFGLFVSLLSHTLITVHSVITLRVPSDGDE